MNPVHEIDGAWYFWDECWAFRHGPYTTKENAEKACLEYAKELFSEGKHETT